MANTVQRESKVVYLQIGQNYEHLAENKQFDVSEWVEAYPDATIYILFRRPGEDVVAPVQTTLEDGILTWTISNWETGIIGVGFAEIRAIDSITGLVKKSHVIPCSVEASVTDEDTAPDFPSWIDRMITMNEHLESVYADFNQELADGITTLRDESGSQQEAIQAKGAATIASIPMSYTDLIAALAGATYNPNRHYGHDEFVWYDNALWKRVTDSPDIVGPWNEDDWTRAALTAHVTEALWQVESMQREIYNSIAPAWNYYDSTASYAVGDYVINREKLYRCISPVSGGGDFNYNKWEVVTIAGELHKYVQASAIASEYSASSTYTAGQYVWYSGNVYRCKTDISTAEAWTAAHWQLVKIGDELTDLKSAITELTGVDETVIPTWTTSKRLAENGGVVNSSASFAYSDKIYIVDAEEQKAYGLHSGSAFAMPSLHFYNSSDEHIGYAYVDGTVDLSTYITQYSPVYIRISHYATDSYPFNGVSVKFKTSSSIVEIESNITTMQGDISSLDSRSETLEDNVETLSDAVGRAIFAAKRNPHNLLYGVALTEGKRWMANASAPVSASGYFLTDFIPVEQGKLYALVADLRKGDNGGIGSKVYYAQFDASKNIILQGNDGRQATITPGENTAFFRISYLNNNINPIFTYAPFTGDIVDPVPEIVNTYKAVSAEEITFRGKNTQYENLLESHKGSIAKSKYLVNGLLTNNNNWMALADYIPCKPSTNYNFAVKTALTYNPTCKIAWYTADGTFISDVSNVNNTSFVSPENAQYFRIAVIQKNETRPTAEEDFTNYYLAETETPYGPPCVNPHPVFTDIYPASSLYGKKWFAFGDSITEKNIRSTINYHDFIRQETGIDVYNKGVGGSGYKNRWQNGNCMYQLAETAATELATADVVTCMAGINDAWSELTTNMGDATDVFDASATAQNQSVMACFNHFLDVIIASAPYAKIGIISPLPCYHTSGSTLYDFKPDNDTSVLAVFIEKCKTACENRGIPYLDLFHTSGLRPWDSTFNSTMFKCNSVDSPDGLHPNYLGHKYFYPLVREFLKQLI